MDEIAARNVVVIGGSAGAVEAILTLFERMGPIPAQTAMLIVVHQSPGHVSHFPSLLARRGHRAALAVHGEPIMGGRVYIAPSDNHLEVRDGHLYVARGPRENNQRPSVDVLFRSAAQSFESAVIAVLFSGYLDCGTAGMLSVKARGGTTIVQEPSEALVPDMPRSAIAHASIDVVAPASSMGGIIRDRLAALDLETKSPPMPPELLAMEGVTPGEPAPIVCPICSGVLTSSEVNHFEIYRCHVGHAFTLARLERGQTEAVEDALWAAVRALEEAAGFADRMSARAHGELSERFAERARVQTNQARQIRALLVEPAADGTP